MKNKLSLTLLSTAFVITLPSISFADSVGSTINKAYNNSVNQIEQTSQDIKVKTLNSSIYSQVKAKYALNKDIDNDDIQVSVRFGDTVYLSGTVDDYLSRRKAIVEAYAVPGVMLVVSELGVVDDDRNY